MLKKICLYCFVFLVFSPAGLNALAEKNEVTLFFSGQPVGLTTTVIEEKGVLLVPAQEWLTRAGFGFIWDGERGQLTAIRAGDKLTLVFLTGSPVIKINGAPRTAPTACRTYQSNFYIPVNFVTRLLNMEYGYSEKKIQVNPGFYPKAPLAVVQKPPVVNQPVEKKTGTVALPLTVPAGRVLFERIKMAPPDYSGFFNQLPKQKNIQLRVMGNDVFEKEKLFFYQDELMVSLTRFFEALEGGSVSRSGESFEAVWGKYFLKITVNSDVVDIGEGRRRMPAEARIFQGEVLVPLRSLVEYLEMGLTFDSVTGLMCINPRLVGLAVLEVAGQKIIKLVFSHPVGDFQAKYLEAPDRLILDCSDTVLDVDLQELKIDGSDFSEIRLGQFAPDITRLVIGLGKIKTYFISHQPQDEVLLISLVPWLEAIEVVQNGENTDIKMKTTNIVLPRIFELKNPERLILDFSGVAFKADNLITVESGPVERIRGSQFKIWPLVTRLVIDLAGEVNYDLKSLPDEQRLLLSVSPLKKEAAAVKREKVKKYDVLKGKVVVIDPGHGGDDPGAITGGIYEKNLTLTTAQLVSRLLNEAGATCLLVLEDDVSMSLAERVNFANSNRAAVFISLHYNASFSKNMEGTESYYFKSMDYPLAEELQKAMLGSLKRKDNFLRRARFYVLTHAQMPTALIEPVYVTNDKELKMVVGREFQKQIAQSVLQGLVNYFEKHKGKVKR